MWFTAASTCPNLCTVTLLWDHSETVTDNFLTIVLSTTYVISQHRALAAGRNFGPYMWHYHYHYYGHDTPSGNRRQKSKSVIGVTRGGGPPRVTPSRGWHPNEKIFCGWLYKNSGQTRSDRWKRCGKSIKVTVMSKKGRRFFRRK